MRARAKLAIVSALALTTVAVGFPLYFLSAEDQVLTALRKSVQEYGMTFTHAAPQRGLFSASVRLSNVVLSRASDGRVHRITDLYIPLLPYVSFVADGVTFGGPGGVEEARVTSARGYTSDWTEWNSVSLYGLTTGDGPTNMAADLIRAAGYNLRTQLVTGLRMENVRARAPDNMSATAVVVEIDALGGPNSFDPMRSAKITDLSFTLPEMLRQVPGTNVSRDVRVASTEFRTMGPREIPTSAEVTMTGIRAGGASELTLRAQARRDVGDGKATLRIAGEAIPTANLEVTFPGMTDWRRITAGGPLPAYRARAEVTDTSGSVRNVVQALGDRGDLIVTTTLMGQAGMSRAAATAVSNWLRDPSRPLVLTLAGQGRTIPTIGATVNR